MRSFSKIISTWFLFGTFKKIPGTIGSLAALPLLPFILPNSIVGMVVIFTLSLLGFWSVNNYMRYYKITGDPSEVIIDEVIGQLLTTFLVFTTLGNNISVKYHFSLYFACFIFFRFFDIAKVWPISFIDKKLNDTFGIILDDILAAIFAYLSIMLLCHLL